MSSHTSTAGPSPLHDSRPFGSARGRRMNTHVRTSFANLSARAPPRPHLTCGGSSASEPPLSCFEPGRRRRDKKVQKERDGEHTKCPSRQRCGAGLVRARTWPNEHRHRLPLPRHLPLVIIVARPGAVTALSPILVARKREPGATRYAATRARAGKSLTRSKPWAMR